MLTQSIIALGVVLILSSCESVQSQVSVLTRPYYSGPVTTVDQPVTINVAPMNRKATFKGETIRKVSSGSKVQQSYLQNSGTIESYQFGDNVQITYILDHMGDGNWLQPTPPFVIKIEMDKNGTMQNLQFGGVMLDQAKPDERNAVQALGKSITRWIGASTSNQPVAQGDVVQSGRIFDMLKEMFAEMKLSQSEWPITATTGSGFVARLAGKTIFDGRPAYVILLDGHEVMSDGQNSMTATLSGYSLIDAATGLYSASHILTKFSGRVRDGAFTVEELQNNRLKF